jgi:hypothetical protein
MIKLLNQFFEIKSSPIVITSLYEQFFMFGFAIITCVDGI